jgi:hypothetical protein
MPKLAEDELEGRRNLGGDSHPKPINRNFGSDNRVLELLSILDYPIGFFAVVLVARMDPSLQQMVLDIKMTWFVCRFLTHSCTQTNRLTLLVFSREGDTLFAAQRIEDAKQLY